MLVLTLALEGCAAGSTGESETTAATTTETTMAAPTLSPTPTPVPYDASYELASRLFLELTGGTEVTDNQQSFVSGLSTALDASVSPKDVVSSIVSSEYFASQNLTDSEYIKLISRVIGDFETDEIMTQYWVDQISYGAITREDVLDTYTSTVEFGALCMEYGFEVVNEMPDTSEFDFEYTSLAMYNLSDVTLASSDDVTALTELQNTLGKRVNNGSVVQSIGDFIPSSEDITALWEEIDSLERSYTVSFVMIDIATGKGIMYNPNDKLYTASSIKGPFAVSLSYYDPEGAEQYASTITSMISVSNNDAYSSLSSIYGRTYIQQWCEECGVDPEPFRYKYAMITSSQLALLWLRNYEYFSSDDCSDEFRTLFEGTLNSIISETLGQTYTVRSKAGWMIGIVSGKHDATVDAGVVYAYNGDYVMVIMTSVPSGMNRLENLTVILDSIHSKM